MENGWRNIGKLTNESFLMGRMVNNGFQYSIMRVLKLNISQPAKTRDVMQLYRKYNSYTDIDNVADRLKWLRQHKGLKQGDVAEMLGITRKIYGKLEWGKCELADKEYFSLLDKLAQLYDVPVTDLLDDYTQFMYKGQSEILSKSRLQTGLNMKKYALSMGMPISNYNDWENGTVLITRKTWEKYLKK